MAKPMELPIMLLLWKKSDTNRLAMQFFQLSTLVCESAFYVYGPEHVYAKLYIVSVLENNHRI